MAAFPPASSRQAADRIHVLEVVGNGIVGGMESYVERLIERLPRERFRTTALCPCEGTFPDRLRALDIEVFVTPMPEEPAWASIQLATALVASGGIDLLHAHLPNAHLLAALAGRLAGKPVLTTIHGRQLSLLDLELHRSVGSHLSVVCRQSYFHALGLGVNANLLSCDANGVDTDVFQPRARSHALRGALGLADDAPLVGFVGRLSPEKGPEVFVRAALLLRGLRPDAHAAIVGDGPLFGTLRGLIDRYGLGSHVHLAGVRADMPAVYADLDIAVSTSHSEAMPLAVMEAMASGLPVVATRVGGVPELIEHGATGWLVAPADFEDVAGRCAALVADADLRTRTGRAARTRAVERLSLVDNIERIAALLTRLARPRGDAQRRVGAGVGAVVSAVPGSEMAAGARRSSRPIQAEAEAADPALPIGQRRPL